MPLKNVKGISVWEFRKWTMWGLPERQPFNIGPYKIWPCFSKPEFQWFAAIEGKPFYFKTSSEVKLFVKDLMASDDPDGVCG